MDYEKKYNEAVKTASYWHENMEGDVCSVLEEIFPELKESKDEKIRRIVYDWINTQPFDNGISKRDMLAWLEKKCEQKPTNKAKPKFHKGDWIVHDVANFTFQIVGVGTYGYTVLDKEGHTWTVTFGNEGNYHLWAITDAKDGDVLSDGSTSFIFKDLLSDGSVMSYCDYDTDSGESDAFCPLSMNLMYLNFTPATKEQRGLLVQKMKEAGYEWNAEKRELRKIEQKSAWGEEDENMLKSIIATCKLAEQDRDSSPARHLYEMQTNWLKSLKERMKGE